MKADLSSQWRLLDVQKLDTRLDQLAHRERTLPAAAELEKVRVAAVSASEEVVLAQTAVDDVDREITKADDDVSLVRDRARRDQERLDSGSGSAKELSSLQHELATLARRQQELEDLELEVMERAETLRGQLAERIRVRDELDEKVRALEGEVGSGLAEVQAERVMVERDRDQIRPGLSAELLALYDRLRAQYGGIAAAPLIARRCGGCQLELTQADVSALRAAPESEVQRCPECSRILVRTAESGL